MLITNPKLFIGACLAIQAVQASPIRVVVVSSSILPADVQHSPNAYGGPLSAVHFTGNGVLSSPPKKHGCGDLKNKSMDMTNSLRKLLGLETVQPDSEYQSPPFIVSEAIRGPNTVGRVEVFEESTTTKVATIPHPHHYRLRPSGASPAYDQNLVQRIHAALVALGPWEARAVAFVLGCGIGVLFRMIWVFAVLLFRGDRSEEDTDEAQYTLVIENVRDAEELPPKYSGDEKHILA
jgi:hypothetical protein